MRLFRFERRWMVQVFEAIYPLQADEPPRPPLEPFVDALMRRAPFKVALGLRVALWAIFMQGPQLAWYWWGSFSMYGPANRAKILDQLSRRPFYILREIPNLFKVMGAMAIFGTPEAQRALGVEVVDATPPDWAAQ